MDTLDYLDTLTHPADDDAVDPQLAAMLAAIGPLA